MRLISWNVNGFRACINKGFCDFLSDTNADIFCIQETKMHPDQSEFAPEGYYQFWNSAEKRGYSGTAVFTREKPLNSWNGIGNIKHDSEGRVITLEFNAFFLVNVYAPNAQQELARIDYRMGWEDAFRNFLLTLNIIKPVIICGDLNVAHTEMDLKNPKPNIGSAGFSDQERGKFTELLSAGFIDTFRYLYPNKTGAYTWWSYRFKAKEHNAGWRIDYFLISDRLKASLKDAVIFPDVTGSDHCPIGLELI